MLQSTFFDPVLGLDTHIVGVPAPPAPAPVPTPIPMPFVGLVFDPLGMAIGAAVGMALGSGPGIVLVNSMPVTNCGTDVTNKFTMPHIPAPGVMFIPPPMPSNDAMLFFGSLNVSLAGTYGVRLGDVALSCSDPVRLPTSVVMAIPKGAPVLNMPAMVPDLVAIAMAAVVRGAARALGAVVKRGAALFRRFRAGSAFFQRVSRALGGCDAPAAAGRWRQMWSRGVRFITGHPVDVVTGNLFTSVCDVELPGPLPLVIERVYESAGSDRPTALGYGWNHSLDESLWFERGRAVMRGGDGREIEFPLWDLADRTMRPGDAIQRVIHKLTLRCVATGRFELERSDGRVHEFAAVPGGDPHVARLVRIRSRDGYHAIDLAYDDRARLDRVRDSGGRVLLFEHDDAGRLVAIKLPIPQGRGWYRHRQYFYDAHGDLVEVRDAIGHSWRYLYQAHLLVQETDRSGLSFYFQYDSAGANARCVRTWGDGGIYDHVIAYDTANRKTIVEDSLGGSTIYAFNVRNQVVAVTNPLGATTRYEYDAETGGQTVVEDPMGARIVQRYDAAGNLIEIVAPGGGTTRIAYERDLPTYALDSRGGEWHWSYDPGGRLVERTAPSGRHARFRWHHGLLASVEDASGRRMLIEYDGQNSISALTLPSGAVQRYECDNLGRTVRMTNQRGGVTRLLYDPEDRIIETQRATGVVQQTSYDPEGEVVELRNSARHIRIGYGHFRRPLWREEAGARIEFTYDTEGGLTEIFNENGERYAFLRDAAGGLLAETGFDGRTRTYLRDRVGRVSRVRLPSGRTTEFGYDDAGRLHEVVHSDGTFARLTRDPGGLVLTAENESARVDIERDTAGRIRAERVNGREVRSSYDARGHRVELTSSLGIHTRIDRDRLGGVSSLYFGGAVPASDRPDVHFERDGLGLETAREFASGVRVEWERDAAGRPTARRTWTGVDATDWRRSPNVRAALRDQRQYAWGADEQIAAVLGSAGERQYEYDARGRAAAERQPDKTVVRAMDRVGNVYRSADGRDRRYGAGGRLEAIDGIVYEHDEDGNQLRKIEPGGAIWSYHWNGHGMLTQLDRPDGTRLRFQYDAFSRRVARETVDTGGATADRTEFVWDDHVVLHEVDDEDDVVTWHWEPETFTPLVREEGRRRWAIVTDHIGTPTEMYDDGGRLAWRMHLDITGVPSIDVGSARDCPWRWQGQYDEPDVAATYNLFRWFEIPRGSYISQDPTGLSAGTHFYAYVDNPLLQVDPLGLDTQIGDAGERAARRWLESGGNEVIGGIQNPSGHGIDLVYRDPDGRIHVAEVKANSATPSDAQAKGADSFGRSRLSRSEGWELDAEGRRAREALQDWLDANPTKRLTGLYIYADVKVDSAGRARGEVTGWAAWTCKK